MEPNSWKKCKIGDVVELQQGICINKKSNHLLVEEGIPLLRITDLINNTQIKFIDKHAIPVKYITKPNDLIYTRTGQVGLVFKGKIGIIHNNCFRVISTTEDVCNAYIYWFLKQDDIYTYVNGVASGSAQPDLNHDAFKSIDFQYPNIKTQQKIASILSAYDDLIENNTQRIKILEEMAQNIYKEWFVNFRFPNHKNIKMSDSELGLIPEGFTIDKLQRTANIIMGQSPKSEFYNEVGEGLPFHQGVTNFGVRFPIDKVYCTESNRIAETGDILFSVRAPVGRINLSSKRIIIGRGLSAIRSKTNNQIFLYYQLKEKFKEEDCMGSGAIFNSVTKDDLLNLELITPTEALRKKFEKNITPIHDLLGCLVNKNENLRKTRILLLPRLISGEIDVEKLEINTELEVANV